MSKRYEQVKINFTPEQYAELTTLAEDCNKTRAEWIRAEIGSTFDKPRLPTIKRVHKVVNPSLLYEVNKIGINLNQIAHHLNGGQRLLNLQLLAKLIKIDKKIKKLL